MGTKQFFIEYEKTTHKLVLTSYWIITVILFLSSLFALVVRDAVFFQPGNALIGALISLAATLFFSYAHMKMWFAGFFKHATIGGLIVLIMIINVVIGNGISMQSAWLFPAILSCLYFDLYLSLGAMIFSLLFMLVTNAFFPVRIVYRSQFDVIITFFAIAMLIYAIVYYFIVKAKHVFDSFAQSEEKQRKLLDNLKTAIAKSQEVVNVLYKTTEQFKKATTELKKSMDFIAQNTSTINDGVALIEKEAASTEETAAQLVAKSREVAKSAQLANELLSKTAEEAQRGEGIVEHSVEKMKDIDTKWEATIAVIERLQEKSFQIDKITALLGYITRQTNLLAINAAIEASRAGETGKGFGVVAEEVRTLATESAKATSQISEIIDEMRSTISTAVEQGKSFVELLSAQVAISQEAKDALTKIRQDTIKNVSKFTDITIATEEQAYGSSKIAEFVHRIFENVKNISEAAQGSAASSAETDIATEEIMLGSENLLQLARDLHKTIKT